MTTTTTRPGLAERLVARAAARLPGVTRRSFLYRAAVVGSALAVNPFDFVLKPRTAYASVCGSGSSCGSGWTAFCCTINDGANTCPPGSYAAGWWKVDDSAFCRGGPRYYVDCNRSPGSRCNCHCAEGTCDQRYVCCNVFRYGQCHQEVAGITEVVCRVILCTPPWEWDPTCTRTVRSDERTRTHSSPCLPGTWASPIELRYQDLGLAGAAVGRPTTPERDGQDGGRYRRYTDGVITWHPDVGAHAVDGPAAAHYTALGTTASFLGYATSEPRDVPGGPGRLVRFAHGTIIEGPEGTFALSPAIYRRWAVLGAGAAAIGYPTGDDELLADGRGHLVPFGDAVMYGVAAAEAYVVQGAILAHYRDLGGPLGPTGLGYPAGPATAAPGGGRQQTFAGGLVIDPDDGPTVAIWGDIADRYEQLGGSEGEPGGPPLEDQAAVGDGRGEVARFPAGTMWSSPETGAHLVTGPVLARYRSEGGPTGRLGYPTTGVSPTPSGGSRASFEGGAILSHPGGTTEVVLRREGRDELPSGDATQPAPRQPRDDAPTASDEEQPR